MRFWIRLTLLFVLVGLFPLLLLGLFSYRGGKDALIEEARSHALSISVLKEDALLEWMEGNAALLESVAARPLVVRLTEQLIHAKRGSDAWETAYQELLSDHLLPNRLSGIKDLSILHPATGQVLTSTNPVVEGTFRESEPFFLHGREQVFIDQPRYYVSQERLQIHIAAPIRLSEAAAIGVLTCHLDLEELGRIVRLTSGSHTSQDIYLINLSAMFVTEPKFGKGFVAHRMLNTVGADRVLARERGVEVYDDYRGIAVIGAFRWIESLSLGLLVETDWVEVVQPIRRLANVLIAGGAFMGVLVLLVAVVFGRSSVRPIHRFIAGTAEVGRGNLNFRFPIRGHGEVAQLGLSLNHMTENLEAITTSRDALNREVRARTAAEARLQETVSALRASETQFRLLTDASPVGVFIFQDMILKYVNPAFEIIFGYRPDELVDRLSLMDLTHPDNRQHAHEYISHCLAGTKDLPPFSYTGVRKDGDSIFCEALATSIDYNGAPALLGTIVDVTWRRQAETELRLKNRVYEGSIAANSIMDVDGVIRHVNPSFLRLWGYERDEEAVGKPISAFLADSDEATSFLNSLQEEGEWTGDFTALRQDGSTFISNGHASVILSDANELLGYQSANLDVTEQRLATTRLRRAKEITDSIIESLPGVFYQISKEGRFIRWNGTLEHVTGYSSDEISKMHPLDFFRDEDVDNIEEAIRRVYTHGRAEAVAGFINRWQESTPYLFTGALRTIDEVPYLIGMGTDISELKEIELQLRRSMDELTRSNQDLEQFAYVASHDLQEPLRMVASYTQLLEKRYKEQLDEDARDFIHYAVDGANRMQRLINDLLTYSRVQTRGRPFDVLDLNRALGIARANLASAINDSSSVVTHDELPSVYGDESQLVSLFQNLISNAIKFRGEHPPRIHLHTDEGADMWKISVADNGIGIHPDFHDRIFEIFQRLHTRSEYPGTGIGLALCRRIVERHGGNITVESSEGQGTTFRFTLPKLDKEAS